MKSVLEKAINVFTRGNDSRRDVAGRSAENEQHLPLAVINQTFHSSFHTALSAASSDAVEGDSMLFSKNNVLLKHPRQASLLNKPSIGDGESEDLELKVSLDNHVLIPGFLFVTTRGSNFGTTLILNWTPNCSMEVPKSETNNLPVGQSATYKSKSFKQRCTSISIDLCSMEMIRIFYRMDDSGFIISGELVIKSKEENFKVFYFQNGGLNDLVYLLSSWKCFNHTCHKDSHCHTFTVYCPRLDLSELHPLEGKFTSTLTKDIWSSLKDSEGRITNSEFALKITFFRGIANNIRQDIWPYLLNVYKFSLPEKENLVYLKKLSTEYEAISLQRENRPDGLESMTHQIDKDVQRTDRASDYYGGENNEHLRTLMRILLNYLHSNPEVKYVQGMTDILAPILSVIDNEVISFWSFSNFMKLSSITTTKTSESNQVSLKHQIELLRELMKMLVPSFYQYLEVLDNGISLMFCHRWLLVFLKREFPILDTLSIWESCWTCPDTKFFHLFICIAIIAIYGGKVVEKSFNIDELMVYFNSLSHQMPKDILLSQARGYLHKFCVSERIHCILYELMDRHFWEKNHSVKFQCDDCHGFNFCRRTGFVNPKKELVC